MNQEFNPDALKDKWAKQIADAGAMTESQMRESTAPRCRTDSELLEYINSLVKRPHDYGTCVYAMSLAAVAAFNYVAGQLGATGFQASCADLDILRQTRGLKMFAIRNYEDLLYPQYCNSEKFPGISELMADEDVRKFLSKESRRHLAERGMMHNEVRTHMEELAKFPIDEDQRGT